MNKRRGQSLIELLIITLVLLPLFLLMVSVFEQVHANIVVLSAVKEGARWGSRQPGVEEILQWSVWKTCDSLEKRGYTPDGFTCPADTKGISYNNEYARISGGDLEIAAGWVTAPTHMSSYSGYSFPYDSPDQHSPEGNIFSVPVWVAVRLHRERPTRFVSFLGGGDSGDSDGKYLIVQHALNKTEGRF